uniref:Uncharacterized protein n=1 Tax=Panagrolaimus sp. ES5 TaxID=591445 RepID=A0AC34GAP4_9BILA
MYQQNFDFLYEIIKHILTKASYNLVKKLYFTCKYFPEKFRLYLIDNISRETKITFNDSTKEYAAGLNASLKDKVWIGDKIITSQKCLSLWISKIEKCTINELFITSFEDFSWNDFKILTKAGTLKDLTIGKLLDSANEMVSVEDICVYVPRITKLR